MRVPGPPLEAHQAVSGRGNVVVGTLATTPGCFEMRDQVVAQQDITIAVKAYCLTWLCFCSVQVPQQQHIMVLWALKYATRYRN